MKKEFMNRFQGSEENSKILCDALEIEFNTEDP
jgi:hypothetical protein